MFKFYAELFELTAESISQKSIRRLRWLTIGSLPYLPMVMYLTLNGLPRSHAALPFILVFILCSSVTFTVLMSRIVNRVWALNKYLDEWERDIKQKSMTTAFMAMMYVGIALASVWLLFYDAFEPIFSDNLKEIPLMFLVVLIGAGLYTQIFTQLAVIKPMEEDELERPQFIKTSARNILAIIAIISILGLSIIFALGYYSGHKAYVLEHEVAKKVCGEAEVDTHKKRGAVVMVTCDGSDAVLRFDLETMQQIDP